MISSLDFSISKLSIFSMAFKQVYITISLSFKDSTFIEIAFYCQIMHFGNQIVILTLTERAYIKLRKGFLLVDCANFFLEAVYLNLRQYVWWFNQSFLFLSSYVGNWIRFWVQNGWSWSRARYVGPQQRQVLYKTFIL